MLRWCEGELGGVKRSDYTRDAWNKLVFEHIDAGTLVPGCEEDISWSCEDTALKYRLISVFLLHRTAEAKSANTVAVLPGGTEAISGGDDGQVPFPVCQNQNHSYSILFLFTLKSGT